MAYRIGIDARMYSARFTGIGRYNYELIHHLVAQDTENTYVIFLNDPEYSEFETFAPNVEKVLVNARHYSLKEQTTFLKKLMEAKLDLMHFTHFNSPLLYPGKQVVTIHDLTLSFYPGKKMTAPHYRAAYNLSIWGVTRKAKRIIAISENTKKDLRELLHVPEKKIRVIYEGAAATFQDDKDPVKIADVRQRYGLERQFILYAGVWRSHKNVGGLIEAYAHMVQQGYAGDLVITGRQDPLYNEVPDGIAKHKLEGRVHCVGLVPEEDLGVLFNAAQCFVFPSFYEGFGLPALEAFAAGTPVAASNTSCLPEICGEGNALFFNPQDPEDMAKKILQAATDEPTRQRLIQNGKERLKVFSWAKMARETHDLYMEALRT